MAECCVITRSKRFYLKDNEPGGLPLYFKLSIEDVEKGCRSPLCSALSLLHNRSAVFIYGT